MLDILPCSSYILLVLLTSEVSAWIPKYYNYILPSTWVFFIESISTFRSWLFYSFPFPLCAFKELRDLFTTSFINPYHIHKGNFKVFVLHLCCSTQVFCSRVNLNLMEEYCPGYYWFCFSAGVYTCWIGKTIILDADILILLGECFVLDICLLSYSYESVVGSFVLLDKIHLRS